MTTIVLLKARDTLRPVRRDEALEGLSDASLGFSTRYADGGGGVSGITSSPGLGERMPRDIGVTRAAALYPSGKPLWKE
jgi:hypothetical protein